MTEFGRTAESGFAALIGDLLASRDAAIGTLTSVPLASDSGLPVKLLV